MNKANLIKTLTLVGKLAAGAGAFTGALDPKTAAVVFAVSSVLKDVTSTLVNLLGSATPTTGSN